MNLQYQPINLPLDSALAIALGGLLVDAVSSGAAVSFMQPLEISVARDWWLAAAKELQPRGAIMIASDAQASGPLGCVMLQPAWAPNQPHRAEICKLIVHSAARGTGIATGLMHAAESFARQQGFTLLTLDCRKGAPAESLYRKLGWIEVGQIPGFALNADRSGLHEDVIFYKTLA